jgi:hypothetical protein
MDMDMVHMLPMAPKEFIQQLLNMKSQNRKRLRAKRTLKTLKNRMHCGITTPLKSLVLPSWSSASYYTGTAIGLSPYPRVADTEDSILIGLTLAVDPDFKVLFVVIIFHRAHVCAYSTLEPLS